MNRVSINQMTTRNWWLEEDAIRYASFGFDTISVWRDKLSDYSVDYVTTLFSDLDLNVACVHWAGGFTGSDGKSYDEGIQDATEAIRQTAQLGSQNLIVHSGARGLHTGSHANRLFRSALKSLIPTAQDYGVQLLTSPIPSVTGKDWTILRDFEAASQLCDSLPVGGLGLVLNTFHWADEITEIVSRRDYFRHVKMIQICDRVVDGAANRALPGQGSLPIRNWMALFCRHEFCGQFEIEVFGPGVEQVTYANRLQLTKEFISALPKSVLQNF